MGVVSTSTPHVASDGGLASGLLVLQFLNQLCTHHKKRTQYTEKDVQHCIQSLKQEEKRRNQVISQKEVDYSELAIKYLDLQNISIEAARESDTLKEALETGGLEKQLSIVKKKDEELKKKDKELKEKSEELKKKDEDLQKKAEELKEKDGELRKKDEDLQKKAEELKEKDGELRKKDEDLNKRYKRQNMNDNEFIDERKRTIELQKMLDEIQKKLNDSELVNAEVLQTERRKCFTQLKQQKTASEYTLKMEERKTQDAESQLNSCNELLNTAKERTEKDIYILENQLSIANESLKRSTESQRRELEKERNKTKQLESSLRSLQEQQRVQNQTIEAELQIKEEKLKKKDKELEKKHQELTKKDEKLQNITTEFIGERNRTMELYQILFEMHTKPCLN